MADTDTLIANLKDRLIYLVQKDGKWFGRCETWDKFSERYDLSKETASTSTKTTAQEYALRKFLELGDDHEAAKRRNATVDWRPSTLVIVVRRIPEGKSPTRKSCEWKGCKQELKYAVEFTGADAIPKDWPHREQYFCKGHITKFKKDRGLPISR